METTSTPRAAIDRLTVYGRRRRFSWKAVVIAYLIPSADSTASINGSEARAVDHVRIRNAQTHPMSTAFALSNDRVMSWTRASTVTDDAFLAGQQ
jgi:hypothetical protein